MVFIGALIVKWPFVAQINRKSKKSYFSHKLQAISFPKPLESFPWLFLSRRWSFWKIDINLTRVVSWWRFDSSHTSVQVPNGKEKFYKNPWYSRCTRPIQVHMLDISSKLSGQIFLSWVEVFQLWNSMFFLGYSIGENHIFLSKTLYVRVHFHWLSLTI